MEQYIEIAKKVSNPPVGDAPVAIVGAMLLKNKETKAMFAALQLRVDSKMTVTEVGVRVFLRNKKGEKYEVPANFWYTEVNARDGERFGETTPLLLPEKEVANIVTEVAVVRFADGTVWHLEHSCNGREEGEAEEEPQPEELSQEEQEAREAQRKKRKKIVILSGSAVVAALLIIFVLIPFVKYSVANSKLESGSYDQALSLYGSLKQYGASNDFRVISDAMQRVTEGEYERGIKTLLDKDVTVHVMYDVGEGAFEDSAMQSEVSYKTNSEFTEMPLAAREYYAFNGWRIDSATYSDKDRERSAEMDFSAQYDPIPYQITYNNLLDGTTDNPTEYNVETEDITLEKPVRTGYTFVGWTEAETEGVQESVVIPQGSHGDKEFAANWQANKYTVHLSANGETVVGEPAFDEKDLEFTFDEPYKLPKMEKRGHTFLGWSDGTVTYLDGTWKKASDVKLTPKFGLTVYKLTYELAGGTVTKENPQTYTMQDKDIALSNATRFGYQFVGWTWDGMAARKDAILPSGSVGDKLIVAVWEGNRHTVSMNANGGTVSSSTLQVVFGSPYTLPVPVKTGYNFDGWYSGGKKYTSGVWDLDQDINVQAKWTPKTYRVSLNFNGGSGSGQSFVATYDSSYTLPTPSRTGYTFLGWYEGGRQYSGGTWKTDADVTLTASWEGKKYHVSLDANGGYVSRSGVTVQYGESYSLPEPGRTGYNFVAWMTGGKTVADFGTWQIANDVSLTAKWEIRYYTLTMRLNGGSMSGSTTKTLRYEEYYSLPTPSQTGYTFDGWYYGSRSFASSGDYDYDDDITIDAHWTPKTYTCRLNASGGSGVPDSISMTYGSSYSLPTPKRDGYTFNGWYDGSYKFPSSGTWTETGSVSLTAKWTKNPTPSLD